MAAKSYLDPSYQTLAASMESRFGLPKGLLHAVVTKGERSNADQVSEKGARTVFQIIPSTRRAALEKFGVDAYLSAENAAEVAARLLKESLERNGGDVKTAVAEYHGGTDPANHGPRTRAYVGRVASTFDRVKAARAEEERPQAPAQPSIAKVYEAYKAGLMSPEEATAFVKDVNSGAIILPRGATIDVKPTAAELPAGVVEAYNSHSKMTDAERDMLDGDIAAGMVRPPKGATLRRPAPRTAGDYVGMGVRSIAEGVPAVADIVLNPILATANAAYKPIGAITEALGGTPEPDLPYNQFRGAGKTVSDVAGLATPETDQERLNAAIIEGGAQGLLTAGVGMAGAGAKGATGAVMRGLAENPATDIAASAAAAGAMEAGEQAGLGPMAQLALGVAAGVPAGVVTKNVAARVERAFGPKAAKVVETTPREAVVDEKGSLTEEGREVAARNDLTEAQVKGAYDEAAKPEPEPVTVRATEAGEAPISVVDETVVEIEGVPHVRVRDEAGTESYAPAAEIKRVDAPEAAPATTLADDAPLPASAAARVAEAGSEGIDLTKGQATQDFSAQSAEQDLAGTQTPEGQRVRDHFTKQAEQIKGAAQRFKEGFGDTTATPEDRGLAVKAAITELRDLGKAGVTALYQQARDLAEGLGHNAENLIHLDTDELLTAMREVFIDEGVDDGVRRALKQQAAKYGLIGDTPRTVEGETTVTLKDSAGEPGGKVTFTGPPQRLTILNAEDFRQFLNKQFQKDTTGALTPLKRIVDEAVESAVERTAREGPPDVGGAFKAARAAHREQKRTFEGKDIVQRLVAWKKGAENVTPELNPEKAIKAALGPDGSVSDLKKVKAVLLPNPTERSRAAWKAIQAQGVANLFEKALTVNANLGDAGFGSISGAKLASEIARFGEPKLKVLLDEADFNQLMKLRRMIRTATVPLPRTTNPSGSGNLLIRFFAKQAQNLAPVAKVVPFLRDMIKGAEEMAAAKAVKETVKGVESFTPEAAANADTPKAKVDPAAFIRKFIRVAGSDEIIAPVIAAAANEERP